MLEVRLIGKFDIRCDGKQVTLSSRVAQSLFAYLILTAGTVHRREKLAGLLWPDIPEAKARAYLRNELWRIRKVLSPSEYLMADGVGIHFDSASEYSLDAKLLEDLKEDSSAEEFIAVLSTYQGELLPGFYDEWIVIEREHFRAVYEQKLARLLQLLEDEKRWQDILVWAERWLSHGHGSEEAYRYMMIAYDAIGDRAKVTSAYQRCLEALRELDLEPSEQTRVLAFQRTPRLNIPIPLTSFIGREQELKEVARLLSKSRLVTLTGSGGVGKTRLATQVVTDILDRFPDGVWFLDLAPLRDPTLVPNTLMSLLGLRETGELPVTDQLISFFQNRTALVIFDNCEHVIETCAQLVHALLAPCDHLFILATSREALRVSGEAPYRVPSLEIAEPDAKLSVDDLCKTESVRLFVERAVVARSGFTIGTHEAFTIARICRRLDGIPLAIELAAARASLLTVDEILKRLDDRFRFLTGGLRSALPRHQTLRATIEWSYDLLSEQERILFRRLAIFMGGSALEAAEDVCSDRGIESFQILDLLSQLVNKSLVLVETVGDETRYSMLETIRQLGREKIRETAEVAWLQNRHLAHYLRKAEEIESELIGADQPGLLNYLERELENIRLSLDWSITNQRGEEALRLFGALGWFWVIRCHFLEGIEWFRRALQLRETVSKSVLMKALRHAGSLYYNLAEFDSGRDVLKESLQLCRELGDVTEISTGLQFLGVLETGQGNLIQARNLLEESLIISRNVNNKPAITRALLNLAFISQIEGNYLGASRQYEEGLAICREMQDSHLTSLVLGGIGDLKFEQGKYLSAREFYGETLALGLKIKNTLRIAETLLLFARVLCAEAKYIHSAQLQGFAVAMLDEAGLLSAKANLPDVDKLSGILKKHLGDTVCQQEFRRGTMLRLEEAVTIALKLDL